MTEKSCKTCEFRCPSGPGAALEPFEAVGPGCGRPEPASDFECYLPSRTALEARVAELGDALTRLAAEAERVIYDVIAKATEARMERELMRAQVAARDEEIATLRARVEDWAAQYRVLSESVAAERARAERAEARARELDGEDPP